MTSPPPSPTAAPGRPWRRAALRFGPAAVLVAVALGAWWAGLPQALSLQGLADRQAALHAAAQASPVLAVGAYVLVFAVVTGAGLPVALVLTLASGALFGPVVGGGATAIAAVAGATLTYAAARSALAPWLAGCAARDPRLRRILQGFGQGAFSYVLTLRFMPVAPFALVNLACGLAAVPLRAFLLATLAAAMVTSFLYASLGAGLGRSLADERSVRAALASPALLWPIAGLAVLALLPTGWRLWRARLRRPSAP
jgi:uncharacterized membrane protein YdjX (TVP38/TMEM64 family)